MNLTDTDEIRRILQNEGFSFKKSLGQNFLINPNVCPDMAACSCDGETGVIEIGPGAGVLTRELCKRAKRVVAVELDERLKPVLSKTLADFNNVTVIFGDIMKTDINKIITESFSDCKSVNICANLPYYITSPIVMSLLEKKLPIGSVTVMVQKEAAQRLCARVGTRDAGAVTVAVSYFAESEILFYVDRNSFVPAPNVDSAVIKLTVRKQPSVNVNNEKAFFSLVKACFAQRRKTLVNTVSNTLNLDKEVIKDCLIKLSLSPTVRGEELTMEQLAKLSDMLYEK